ncbi:UbiA prenyltransferase family-domain-containing protein [Nemania sp. FL0031]|nr:UbiA prenyltransferase family-domain-containing protein [Nemania sp. FL0031]
MAKRLHNQSPSPDTGPTDAGENSTTVSRSSNPQSYILISFKKARFILKLFWLITRDDAATFVGPNTTFGLCGALAGPVLVAQEGRNQLPALLFRLPRVVFFNWSNLLVFDLANQRLPESVLEDALNKPWRPGPSGLATPSQIRRAMLLIIPAVWVANYSLDVSAETALLMVLTWLYNDLMGGDEGWILRNVIISAAFGLYNLGSVKVAAGLSSDCLTPVGVQWTLAISGVILTTMHVQDLKDQHGDRSRGRQSAPIVLGDRVARWTIAVPVVCWSLFCTYFWGAGVWGSWGIWGMVWGLGIVTLGFVVALRCLMLGGPGPDRLTWQLWAAWTAAIYALPCIHYYGTAS